MLILTPELKKAVETVGGYPVTLIDPDTQRSYVLLPIEEYEKLSAASYDDSPWTDDEMEALSDDAQRSLDGQTTQP